jgi:hypothetical protein
MRRISLPELNLFLASNEVKSLLLEDFVPPEGDSPAYGRARLQDPPARQCWGADTHRSGLWHRQHSAVQRKC